MYRKNINNILGLVILIGLVYVIFYMPSNSQDKVKVFCSEILVGLSKEEVRKKITLSKLKVSSDADSHDLVHGFLGKAICDVKYSLQNQVVEKYFSTD